MPDQLAGADGDVVKTFREGRRRRNLNADDFFVRRPNVPRTMAADSDRVVLAQTARRQWRLRLGLAVCPFGPIAQPGERDIGTTANLCQTDILNVQRLCQRSQWLAPHQIVKLLPRKFAPHRASRLLMILIVGSLDKKQLRPPGAAERETTRKILSGLHAAQAQH